VRECRVDAPRTLVVHDVSPNLTDLFRRSGKVKVVVLDLEVLAEREEDIAGYFVIVRIGLVLLLDGESAEEQRKSYRKVKRVYCGLVEDNRPVPACLLSVYF
jgi:hypothetical protein